jgi:agmatine deiminase
MLEIPYGFLPGTKDVWAKDYMPIQITHDKFVQFIYDPAYLKEETIFEGEYGPPEDFDGTFEYLKTDPTAVCEMLGIETYKSKLVIDGGNVIKWTNKAILSSRIYKENPDFSKNELHALIKKELEIEELIIVPEPPYDYTGHADGIIRFIDENRVFINDLSEYSKTYQSKLLKALAKANLEYIELPIETIRGEYGFMPVIYGLYINYLEMEQGIIVPSFMDRNGFVTGFEVWPIFEQVFPNKQIIFVESSEIAANDGILNYISWAIKK